MTNIIVIGDRAVSPENMKKAASELNIEGEVSITALEWYTEDRKDLQRKNLNIENNGPTVEEPPVQLDDLIEDCHILITHLCPISEDTIKKGKKLQLIATNRGGMEHIDVVAATKRDIPVMHVIRNAEATSDFTIGLMIAETRNIARSHADVMAGGWSKQFANSKYTTSLKDMKLGIVGMGHIGRLVAKKAIGLGMTVVGYDPFVSQDDIDDRNLSVTMIEIKELFSTCDVVSLHLRVTKETENMVDKSLLSLMKPTAYLINTSRARVIHKEDLYNALSNKEIGGCGLDVTWEEPMAKDDPYLTLDNITITAHIAGSVVDALPKSPWLLTETINDYWKTGKSDMKVN